MYNEEIYQKLLDEFGEDRMTQITDVIAMLYEIKYNAAKNEDALSEFDYERDWWMSKHMELVKQKEIYL